MDELLRVKKLFKPTNINSVTSKDMKEMDYKELYLKACSFIQQWIYDTIIHHVEEEKMVTDPWKKLDGIYTTRI